MECPTAAAVQEQCTAVAALPNKVHSADLTTIFANGELAMAGSDFAKKRKRQDSDSEKEHVSLSVSDLRASQLGPVLGMSPITDEGLSGKSYSPSRAVASFPALQPSNSTPFQCYTRPSHSSTAGASEQEFAAQPIIIAGETDSVEFYSTNEAETVATGCK